jgi:hypothetical protein
MVKVIQAVAAEQVAFYQRHLCAQRRRMRRHQPGGAAADNHQAVAIRRLRITPARRMHARKPFALLRILRRGRVKIVLL